MIFFALLGLSANGGQNWFNKRSLETQPIQDSTTGGPSAEEILKNSQPLLEWNGESNGPKRDDIIYL
jgi:hypothetical protein